MSTKALNGTSPHSAPAPHISDVLEYINLTPPSTQPSSLLNHSSVQRARLSYTPRVNPVLNSPRSLSFAIGDPTSAVHDVDFVRKLFPNLFGQPALHFEQTTQTSPPSAKIVGVVLSGGPAPGGHNVISGLYDFIQQLNPENKLLGFVAGAEGILKKRYITLDADTVTPFRNQGGFHIIGSGRTKIESDEQFAAARETIEALDLDALVIVGGDDSNSNAMKLAEDFRKHNMKCVVNGVPKTIDNDMRNSQIEASFGFDTASKSYALSTASLAFDAISARKAYHFVRVMGRSASHIALEIALQVHPNLCYIGEEVSKKGLTLPAIVAEITDLICQRAVKGKNYGVIVVPEGLVEFMPDVESLISELNEILAADGDSEVTYDQVVEKLSDDSKELFCSLPMSFANQLMLERDPHGNVQVAKIEVERLLIGMVSMQLASRKKAGTYSGKFSGNPHYLGYEARCALPTNFDANYTYGLGRVAAALSCHGKTGYVATLSNLSKPPEHWVPAAYPLTMMMNKERRKGKDVAVIRKMMVALDGAPFQTFAAAREGWMMSDSYRTPGPSQFWGPCADDVTLSLALDAAHNMQ